MDKIEFSRIAGLVRNQFINTFEENTAFVKVYDEALLANPDNPYEALPDEYKKMFDSVV